MVASIHAINKHPELHQHLGIGDVSSLGLLDNSMDYQQEMLRPF